MLDEQQRINELEKDVLGINHKLDTHGKVLEEIRDVMVQQNQILQNVTSIREMVNQVRHDTDSLDSKVDILDNKFEARKEVTDNNNRNFADFVSKFKGGLAVAMFMFTIVQSTIAFVLHDNYNDHKGFQQELQKLHIENAVIKNSLRIHGIDKTVQNALESNKTN